MKVWYAYGSEHSSNLVIIGSFKSEADASAAQHTLDEATEWAQQEPEANSPDSLGEWSSRMIQFVTKHKITLMGPKDFQELEYGHDMKREKNRLIITTEESEVGALLKVMISKGAKIEVYSAHDYPNTPYGRGKN